MWLTLTEEANQTWYAIELLALSYPYQTVQNKIVKTFSSYTNVLERYSDVTERSVETLSSEFVKEHPEIGEQNIALLRNAIELWKTATRTSDAIAPILVHYSWHCFNSFFVYSFFRWRPQHSKSHGIGIELSDTLENTQIKFFKDGLFRRIVDTWTILGAPLVFSPILPVLRNGEIDFSHNDMYLLDDSKELSLKELMEFNPVDFEKETISKRQDDLVLCPFIANSIYLPNKFLKSYLLLFAASSIARYRPILWRSILNGEGKFESEFCIDSRDGVLDYVLGEKQGLSLIRQTALILENIEKGMPFSRSNHRDPINP